MTRGWRAQYLLPLLKTDARLGRVRAGQVMEWRGERAQRIDELLSFDGDVSLLRRTRVVEAHRQTSVAQEARGRRTGRGRRFDLPAKDVKRRVQPCEWIVRCVEELAAAASELQQRPRVESMHHQLQLHIRESLHVCARRHGRLE